jgi:hypothetical protein
MSGIHKLAARIANHQGQKKQSSRSNVYIFLERSRHLVFLNSGNFRAACTTYYHLGSRKGDKNTIVAVAKALFDSLHSPSGFVF